MTKQKKLLLNYLLKQYRQNLTQDSNIGYRDVYKGKEYNYAIHIKSYYGHPYDMTITINNTWDGGIQQISDIFKKRQSQINKLLYKVLGNVTVKYSQKNDIITITTKGEPKEQDYMDVKQRAKMVFKQLSSYFTKLKI